MTIEDFVTKFVNLMRYVPREEKEKVHSYMSFLPQVYKDKIAFLNPKTMDEEIRCAKLCFTQFKQRFERKKTWQNRKRDKFDSRKNKLKHPSQTSHGAPIRRNKYNGKKSVSI
jgi:hypothetical protein